MQTISPSTLAYVTGGAARISPRVTTGREELKQGVTTVANAVKDIAASRQNDSSSAMLPMMMMMMKNKQG